MAKRHIEAETLSDNQAMMLETVYGLYDAGSGVILDLDRFAHDFPQSFANAAKRGLAHKFSNEIASSVTSEKEKADKDGTPLSDDEVEALFQSKRFALAEALQSGKLAVSAPGAPRGSGLENIAFEIAFKRAQATLSPKGYWPEANRKLGIKADEATVLFGGVAMTRDEIAAKMLEKYRADILAEAEAVRAERLAKAKSPGPKLRIEKVEEDLSNLI